MDTRNYARAIIPNCVSAKKNSRYIGFFSASPSDCNLYAFTTHGVDSLAFVCLKLMGYITWIAQDKKESKHHKSQRPKTSHFSLLRENTFNAIDEPWLGKNRKKSCKHFATRFDNYLAIGSILTWKKLVRKKATWRPHCKKQQCDVQVMMLFFYWIELCPKCSELSQGPLSTLSRVFASKCYWFVGVQTSRKTPLPQLHLSFANSQL